MSAQSQTIVDDRQASAAMLRGMVARRRSPEARWIFDRDRRRDVRLRLGEPMILELAIGHRQTVTLESLSLGGLGLTGAPSAWEPRWPVAFTLFHKGEALSVIGRVVWRQNRTVGIAFIHRSLDHDLKVHQFLATFLVV